MQAVFVALLLSSFSADPAGPGSGSWQVDPADAHGLNASLLEAMGEAIFKKVPWHPAWHLGGAVGRRPLSRGLPGSEDLLRSGRLGR